MKIEEIKQRAEKIKFWHSIELPSEDNEVYITKGMSNHSNLEMANNYFGIPKNLKNKHVLDVGAWDGYFSFLAESRGAKVKAIDSLEGWHKKEGTNGFDLAKEVLKSNVDYEIITLEEFAVNANYQFDIVFLFGTLYHVEEPLKHLHALSKLTKEYAIIETAISSQNNNTNIWEFNHGLHGDKTNYWYPSLKGLESALKFVGFDHSEIIKINNTRATFKAFK